MNFRFPRAHSFWQLPAGAMFALPASQQAAAARRSMNVVARRGRSGISTGARINPSATTLSKR